MSNRAKKNKIWENRFNNQERSKSKTSFLENIDKFVDWKSIETLINKHIKRNKNSVGNPAFQNINMFRILLLQRFYNLSDREIDDALAEKISFRIFVGFF